MSLIHNTSLTLDDLDALRGDTPGVNTRIHFNNAGASLQSQTVLDATIRYLNLEAHIGGYEAAVHEKAKFERLYQAAAELINAAGPEEISFHENSTVAWNAAYLSIPFQPGDRILTAHATYASNYLMLMHTAERTGAVIDVIPSDETGQVSLEALESMMDEQVKLIELTHIPTNNGLVNPAEEVGKIAKAWNCLYLLDACQSVGQLPIDVQAIGCDMLATAGRKWLRGPRGSGFLYVRKELLEKLNPVYIDLHSATWTGTNAYEIQPTGARFETGEFNYSTLMGFGTAIDYALQLGSAEIWERIQHLGTLWRDKLKQIPGITVQDIGAVQGGIVTFTMDGVRPEAVQAHLKEHHINVNTTGITSTRLDMEARGLERVVRSSIHYFNSEAELDRVANVLNDLKR